MQERLTMQVVGMLKEALDTDDVAVYIEATHHCVSSRGVIDVGSSTVTVEYSGKFRDPETRQEFLRYVGK